MRIYFKKIWSKFQRPRWTTIRLWSRVHNDRTIYPGKYIDNWLGNYMRPKQLIKIGITVECTPLFIYEITEELAQSDADMSKEALQDWLITQYKLSQSEKNRDFEIHTGFALITQRRIPFPYDRELYDPLFQDD